MDASGRPPQIARPPRSPSHTEYPEVWVASRSSSHPRGDSHGYINVQRGLLPGREQEQVLPPERQPPLNEAAAWWRIRSRAERPT